MLAAQAVLKGKERQVLAASGRFGMFKPESEQAVRKAEVVKDKKLDELLAAWKGIRWLGLAHPTERIFLSYYDAIRNIEYSARDIENLSIALVIFQDEHDFSPRAGHFLSALIFNGKEQEYVIHTAGLPMLACLCTLNNKKVVIDGDGGRYLGDKMNGGSIIVKGDAEDYCGMWMENGSISVRGNALDFCGYTLKGGKINVEGNAGQRCCDHMDGGEIHVRGSVGNKFGWGALKGKVRVDGDITGLPGIANEWKGRECRLYHGDKLVAGSR
jgi:hypothetical protein